MPYTVQLDNGMKGEISFSLHLIALSMTIYTGFTIFSKFLDYVYFMEKGKYKKDCNTRRVCHRIKEEENEDEWETEDTEVETEQVDQSENSSQENTINVEVKIKIPTQAQTLQMYVDQLNDNNEMPDDICDRMKFYETYSERYIHEIDPFTGFVIRLDGNGFSKILNNIKIDEFIHLHTPYVNDFKTAMDKTTADLVKKFNAATGFNHSDEISIMFKPLNKDRDDELIKEHIYRGRIVKLLTLMSSYATIRLQHHLRNLNAERFKNVVDRITFDSHHIIFPNKNELTNYFIWRSKIVCYRSFVREIASKWFSKKDIINLNTSQLKDKLKQEFNNDVDDYNVFLRNGTYVKRELVSHVDNGKTYWYNSYIRFALPNIKCETSYYDLFDCKNFQEWEFQDIDFELLSKF